MKIKKELIGQWTPIHIAVIGCEPSTHLTHGVIFTLSSHPDTYFFHHEYMGTYKISELSTGYEVYANEINCEQEEFMKEFEAFIAGKDLKKAMDKAKSTIVEIYPVNEIV